MDVSIIIVNYNTKELLEQCLESIFLHTVNVQFEVIVVDNGSTDGSVEVFRSDERVLFIESSGNIGFGRANNEGLKYAKGDFVLFLNSDTVLLNNAIFLFHQNAINHGPLIAGMGSILLDANHNMTHSYGSFPRWYDEFLGPFKRNDTKKTINKFPFVVDYVTGAALFVSKNTLDLYGSFDPDFFLYYEETEMQFRWKVRGLKSCIIEGPQIIHFEGASSKKSGYGKKLIMTSSLLTYFKKTTTYRSFAIIRFFIFLKRLPVLIFCTPFNLKRKYFNIFWK